MPRHRMPHHSAPRHREQAVYRRRARRRARRPSPTRVPLAKTAVTSAVGVVTLLGGVAAAGGGLGITPGGMPSPLRARGVADTPSPTPTVGSTATATADGTASPSADPTGTATADATTSPTADATTSPTADGTASPAPADTPDPANVDGAEPMAGTNPAGNPDGNVQDAPADAPNPNCTLVVPANPLSAEGLASPYQLTATNPDDGECHEANADQSAFVEATILDPATGKLSIYRPLVVDEGTQPAVDPTPPDLPANAVVGVWFGSNADTLTLDGHGDALAQGSCVNGLDGSAFGQFAYCNGPALFHAAKRSMARGDLKVPGLGQAKDGEKCPSVRDFSVVDQDQSDNLLTTYLATGDGRTAQNSAANAGALQGATTLKNGSDNALLDNGIDPALGCTPFMGKDLTDPGTSSPSLALNELQAQAHQGPPRALIPLNNPMSLVDDRFSEEKTNLYRAGVGQHRLLHANGNAERYCRHLVNVGPARVQHDRDLTQNAASLDPAAADSLFTFLAARLQGSYEELGCGDLLNEPNPVQVDENGDGVAVGATFADGGGKAGGQAGPGRHRKHAHHHHHHHRRG